MRYELQFFDDLIHFRMEELSIPGALDSSLYEKEVKALNAATKRVMQNLRKNVFFCRGSSEVELYVTHHQAALISLAEALSAYMHEKEIAQAYQLSHNRWFPNLCKLCFQSLEILIKYVETYFSRWFRLEEKVAGPFLFLARRELKVTYDYCRSALLAGGADADLVSLCFYPMEEIAFSGKEGLPFRQLIYFKEQLKALEELLSSSGQSRDSLTGRLFQTLCFLNFNSFGFLVYCQKRCKRLLSEAADPAARVRILRLLIKKAEQFYLKPGLVFNILSPSIKDQMLHWLQAELSNAEEPASAPAAGSEAHDPLKVKTSLPVPVLAYLIRLFIKAHIIQVGNLSVFFRLFSRHISSRHMLNISPVSLRNNYYDPNRSVASSARDLLLRLVHLSKKEDP